MLECEELGWKPGRANALVLINLAVPLSDVFRLLVTNYTN